MFKRFLAILLRKEKKLTLSSTPTSQELDLSKSFRIAVPVVVAVPIGPLDTFSERAQKLLLDEIANLQKRIRTAMFHPMPDGTLRVFTPPEDKKEVKN